MDNQVIYDLIKDMREDLKETVKSMKDHTDKFGQHLIADQRMADNIESLKESMSKNNEILDKLTNTVVIHEARSTNLEKIVIGNKDNPGLLPRVEKLEEPEKVKEFLRKKYMKWGAVVTLTLGIATGLSKFFGLW